MLRQNTIHIKGKTTQIRLSNKNTILWNMHTKTKRWSYSKIEFRAARSYITENKLKSRHRIVCRRLSVQFFSQQPSTSRFSLCPGFLFFAVLFLGGPRYINCLADPSEYKNKTLPTSTESAEIIRHQSVK